MIAGVRLPRVTEILAAVGLTPDFSRMQPDVLEAARVRGTATHEAIEALVYDFLDESTLAPDVIPRLDAYRRFVKESGYEMTHTEIEVVNAAWGYRGHPDSIGWLLGKRVMLDWKSATLDGVAYQLAGYAAAWDAMHPTEPIASTAAVELREDGTYRFHEIELAAALPVWYAAVTVYNAQKGRSA